MRFFEKKFHNSILIFSVFILSFLFTSAKCSAVTAEDADTVFADSGAKKEISKASISFLENFQKANRELSAAVLPSVVTIDVIETRKVRDPFQNFPFFFFGRPGNEDGEKEEGLREYKAEGLGSGIIVRKNGKTYYVLTNQHVIGSASDISIKLYDGREFKSKLVGSDTRKDIALVSFESDDDLSIAKLGDSDSVQVGDLAFAIGSPMGYVSSVTSGLVSAVGRSGGPNKSNINDFIQTDAAINQGNSGGPLVNIYGEVIGINTWIASSSGGSQGLGFSIPINNVKKAVDDFIDNGKLQYGWLGVQLTQVEKEFLDGMGIKNNNGALVAQLFLGSPADKGGIQAGDYIIALNGKEIKSVEHLIRDVGDLRAGEKADFKVIRDKKEVDLTVKIDFREEKKVSDSSKLWPGFSPVSITENIIAQLKLKKDQKGIVVARVEAKSPAVIMGLKSGDVITAVNDKTVSNLGEFYKQLSSPAKEIWFDIIREDQKLSTVRFKK